MILLKSGGGGGGGGAAQLYSFLHLLDYILAFLEWGLCYGGRGRLSFCRLMIPRVVGVLLVVLYFIFFALAIHSCFLLYQLTAQLSSVYDGSNLFMVQFCVKRFR